MSSNINSHYINYKISSNVSCRAMSRAKVAPIGKRVTNHYLIRRYTHAIAKRLYKETLLERNPGED